MIQNWEAIQNIEATEYVCGYCDNRVASDKGWKASSPNSSHYYYFTYICPFCKKPTYIDTIKNFQAPSTNFGEVINDIGDSSISNLYDEARQCMSVNSYTAAVLCCRKLLMNIAVSKGEKEGKKFIEYVEYLVKNHYVPPGSDDWVDHIRKKGNEATHEIAIMTREDAEELISFIEMILKFLFEFPARIKKKTTISSAGGETA